MAVILIDGHKVIIPGDGTADLAANGIPETWENLYRIQAQRAGVGGNLEPAGDIDTGPAANSPTGDGLSTFEEYRGAMVAGKHVRLDPLQKDLFVYVVTGQCPTATSAASLLLAGGYPTPISPNATLTLNLPGVPGDLATFTASAAVFSAANVRGEIIGTAGGRARIIAIVGATTVVAEVTQPFGGVDRGRLLAAHRVSPRERVRPALSGAGPRARSGAEPDEFQRVGG